MRQPYFRQKIRKYIWICFFVEGNPHFNYQILNSSKGPLKIILNHYISYLIDLS
jgi:hypothetical protein